MIDMLKVGGGRDEGVTEGGGGGGGRGGEGDDITNLKIRGEEEGETGGGEKRGVSVMDRAVGGERS